MANLPLAFAELLAGGILIDAGIKGASIADVVKGSATAQPLDLGGTDQGASSAGANSAGQDTAPAGANSPAALAEGTALTGANATQWAQQILVGLGAPATEANLNSLLAWFAHEGGGGANNPLNTTLNAAGATGSINSAGVKSFSTPSAGIAATVQTLEGGYSAIVAALKAGTGLSNAGPGVSSELSTWSGGGYSSL